MIDRHGQEVDGDLVALPSQIELARSCGWLPTDGRVSAYVADLGPAVVDRRPRLVLSRSSLARRAGQPPPR